MKIRGHVTRGLTGIQAFQHCSSCGQFFGQPTAASRHQRQTGHNVNDLDLTLNLHTDNGIPSISVAKVHKVGALYG